MVPTLIFLTAYVFSSSFECIQHLDNESSNPPEHAHVYRLNFNTTIIELYGAYAVLKCRGGNYFAYTLEDRNE